MVGRFLKRRGSSHWGQFGLRFGVALLLSLLLVPWMAGVTGFAGGTASKAVAAQPSAIIQTQPLIQRGLDSYHRADYLNAVALWNRVLEQSPATATEVALRLYLARAYQALGKTYEAIEQFDWLTAYYRHNSQQAQSPEDRHQASLKWGQIQTEQAQNYNQLGHHRRALGLLCGLSEEDPSAASVDWKNCQANSAIQLALQQGDELGLEAALVSLGNVQRLRGKYNSAYDIFKHCLSEVTPRSQYRRIIYENLGTIEAAQASRNIRLAAFAQTQGEKATRDDWLNQAQQQNRAAQEAFSRIGDRSKIGDHSGPFLTENSITPPKTHSKTHSKPTSSPQTSVELSASPYAPPANELSWITNQLNVLLLQRRIFALPPTAQWEAKQLHRKLRSLPPSREKIQALLQLSSLSQDLPERAYDPAKFQFQPINLEPELLQQANINLPAFRAEAPSFCAIAHPKTQSLLQEALQLAKRLQDYRSQSFIAGRLGHLYECQKKFKPAVRWTRNAQLWAPSKEDRFLWDWQAARLWQAQNQPKRALEAYEETLRTLRGIRGELATASHDFQLDFRETIAPIYRGLLDLRLQFYETVDQLSPQYRFDLEDILTSIDELHIFELQNYLGEGCELPPARPLTSYDRHTAYVSTYIQQDRIAIILSLPQAEQNEDGRFLMRSQLYWVDQDRDALIAQVNRFRKSLGKRSDRANSYRADAADLYRKLLRPLEPALAEAQSNHQSSSLTSNPTNHPSTSQTGSQADSQISSLIFMHDGILRSLPMAPLYDGTQFLVEQYALAHTPALSLTDPEPTPFAPEDKLLAYGLSQPALIQLPHRLRYFAPLPYVKNEIEGLQDQISSTIGQLNEQFTYRQMAKDLEEHSPRILHLATHAQFGFDAQNTFLVIHGKKNMSEHSGNRGGVRNINSQTPSITHDALTLERLTRLAQQKPGQLQLLTLSACETATGSERDVLGIAGTAFQTGIWSTLASLWQVDDRATFLLMDQFYRELRQGKGRAIALQNAQKAWLAGQTQDPAYRHPGYWAPFILVGNWL